MTITTCPRFCSFINQHLDDYSAIRQHILDGARCPDAWLALGRMVPTPQQRLDCLKYAAQIEPDDLDLQITYLDQHVVVYPEDADAHGRLREVRALRVVRSVRPRAMLRREPPREIGTILVEMGTIDRVILSDALREQRRRRDQGTAIPLGELLIERKQILPGHLARVLTIQFQERQDCGHSPSLLGEYLVREGYLTLDSLEIALLEQIRLHQLGKHESIGRLLMAKGKLHWADLKKVLDVQAHEAQLAFV